MSRKQINLEYIFKASPAILHKFLTMPDCLIRWYADGVDTQGDDYIFEWNGFEEVAELVDDIEEERVRLKWIEAEDEEEYFEYQISVSPVTNETILKITDYCDEDEAQEQQELWNSQIEKLSRAIGG